MVRSSLNRKPFMKASSKGIKNFRSSFSSWHFFHRLVGLTIKQSQTSAINCRFSLLREIVVRRGSRKHPSSVNGFTWRADFYCVPS